MEYNLLTAFLIGLFGLTHCLGMCGGIVGTLDAGITPAASVQGGRVRYHLSYNLGRIASYAIAGSVAGTLGALAATASFGNAVPVGRMIAGLMMIALGFYLAGWWQAITVLEKTGQRLWRRIEPLGRAFLPVTSPMQALGLGLIWGWLPCGMVYSALALAMASASPVKGALTMIAFGIGTLPALLSFGIFANLLNNWARRPLVLQISGLLIVVFGVYTCVIAIQGRNHTPHSHAHSQPAPETAQNARDAVSA